MRAYRLPVRCSGRNFVSVSEREILNPTSTLWGSSKPFPSGFDGELSGGSETEGLTAGSYVFCVLALRREKARRDGGSRRAGFLFPQVLTNAWPAQGTKHLLTAPKHLKVRARKVRNNRFIQTPTSDAVNSFRVLRGRNPLLHQGSAGVGAAAFRVSQE